MTAPEPITHEHIAALVASAYLYAGVTQAEIDACPHNKSVSEILGQWVMGLDEAYEPLSVKLLPAPEPSA